ncbi:hypothetical protein [Chryseobacterium sp.]|uniref:hypothetical protein n=1 Tax=Chryseobacterium sp. TaxID=1871047 RepID=UPI00333FC4A9
MKKLILGLFLIAGSSSYALAATIEIEKDVDEQESFKANCYTQVIVNVENTCGQYLYSTASPKYTVNCRAGQAEGSTDTYYETRTTGGWNVGTDPNTPSSCN